MAVATKKLTIRLGADTKGLQTGLATANASVKGFGTNLKTRIADIAPALRKTGMALTAVAGAVAVLGGIGVKKAMDFERQLANVSTMLDRSTMPMMEEFSDALKDMSVTFGESTETLSKGLYDILSASIAPTQALYVLDVAARAAAAGITDTGVAADAITTILNSYGMSVDRANIISDQLFATVKRGKTTFAELAPSIGNVAATASIAGLSWAELGAAIATVTRAGISTEETMTAIRGILLAFIKPTNDAKIAAAEFGLELNSNTLRTIGLQGAMELLKDATAEQLAGIFPNVRGLKGMAAALQDTEGFAEDLELQLNATGLTEEAFAKQTDTLSYVVNQLKQGLGILAVEFGELFKPFVREAGEKLLTTLQNLREVFGYLTEEQKISIGKLILMGTAFTALAGIFLMLAPGIVAVLGLIFSPIGLITAGIAALAIAFAYYWPEIKEAVLSAWEKIGPVFQAIWDWLTRAWYWSLDAVRTAWDWLSETAWPYIKNIFQKIRNALTTAWDWSLGAVKIAWDWLGDVWIFIREIFAKIRSGLRTGWEWLLDNIKTAWDWLVDTWDNIKSIFNKIKGHLKTGWYWSLTKVREAWDWLEETAWPYIKGVFEKIKSALTTGWKWSLNTLKTAWDWLNNILWPFIRDIFGKIRTGLKTGWEWFLDNIKVAWDFLTETLWPFIKKGFQKIKDALTTGWHWTLDALKTAWDWLNDKLWPWIEEIFGKIKGALATGWEWTLDKLTIAWDWLSDTVWPAIRETFGKIREGLKTGWIWSLSLLESAWDWLSETAWPAIRGTFNKIREHLKTGWQWTLEGVKSAWNWLGETLWPFIKGIFGKIRDGLKTGWKWTLDKVKIAWNWLGDTIWPRLKEIFQGIWDWLTKAWYWNLDKVKEAWDWFIGLFKKGAEDIKESTEEITLSIDEMAEIQNLQPLIKMGEELTNIRNILYDSSKVWKAYGQEQKIAIASVAAEFLYMKEEAIKVAYDTPLEFAKIFVKEFMSKSSSVQKAILKAISSEDIKKAFDLLGGELGKILQVGRSPGGIKGGVEKYSGEATDALTDSLNKMLARGEEFASKFADIMRPIVETLKGIFQKIVDAMAESKNETIREFGEMIKGIMGFFDDLLLVVEETVKDANKALSKTGEGLPKSSEIIDPWADKIKIALDGIAGYTKKTNKEMLDSWRAFFKEQKMKLWPASYKALQAFLAKLPPAQRAMLEEMYADWKANNDDIEDDTKETIMTISQAWAQFWKDQKIEQTDWLNFFEKTADALSSYMKGIFSKIRDVAADMLGPVGEMLAGLVGGVFAVGAALARGDITTALTKVIGIAGQLVESFLGLLRSTQAYKDIQDILRPVVEGISNAFGELLRPLIPIAQIFVDAFLPFLKAITPVIKELGEVIGSILTPMMENFIAVFKHDIAPFFFNVFKGLIRVADSFKEAWDKVSALLTDFINLFKGLWNALMLAVETAIRVLTLGLVKPELPRLQKGALIPESLTRGTIVQVEPKELVIPPDMVRKLNALFEGRPVGPGITPASGIVSPGGYRQTNIYVTNYGDIRSDADLVKVAEFLAEEAEEDFRRA